MTGTIDSLSLFCVEVAAAADLLTDFEALALAWFYFCIILGLFLSLEIITCLFCLRL